MSTVESLMSVVFRENDAQGTGRFVAARSLRCTLRAVVGHLALAFSPQGMIELSRQRFARVGLAQEIDAFVEAAAMDNRVFRIARSEDHDDIGNDLAGPPRELGLRRDRA